MKSRLAVFLTGTSLMVLGALANGSGAQDETEERVRDTLLFEAGSTQFENRPDGTIVKRFYNSVRAWTRKRDSDLSSNEAIYRSWTGETRFYGAAAFRDSIRYLYADTLIYRDMSEELVAIGNVKAIEKDRMFRTKHVRYDIRNRMVYATDGIMVRDDSLNVLITGREAVFNDSTGYGLIIGNPVMVKEDEKGTIMTVTARDTLEIVKADRLMRIWNDVVVTQDSMRVTAGHAVYDDSTETVVMTVTPRAYHVMFEHDKDALSELRVESRLSGDSIRVFLRDRKVSSIDVLGKASSISVWTDSTDAVFSRSILESMNMSMLMDGDYVSRITAEGRASSYYFKNPATEEKMYVNEATGDTLYFYYNAGKIEQLRISGYGGGGAKGRYYEFSRKKEEKPEEGDMDGGGE